MKKLDVDAFEKEKSELLDWIDNEKITKNNSQSFIDDLNKFESMVQSATISDLHLLRQCWFRGIGESIKLLEPTTFLGLWKMWLREKKNMDSNGNPIKATL